MYILKCHDYRLLKNTDFKNVQNDYELSDLTSVEIKTLQLDWPWIAEWAYAGIFAVAVRFQNQDRVGFLIKKSGLVF